ncbi:MAG: hypothetical protein ACREOZ_03010, partial [Gloeomargaritales cyanobacterium]
MSSDNLFDSYLSEILPHEEDERPSLLAYPDNIVSLFQTLNLSDDDLGILLTHQIDNADAFADLDLPAIEELNISLISRTRLRSYIAWRDANGQSYDSIDAFINVTRADLRVASRAARVGTIPTPEDNTELIMLRRQSAERNRTMATMAEKMTSKKEDELFREKHKGDKDSPKFNGSIMEWGQFKRDLHGYLGQLNLDFLMNENIENTTIDKTSDDYIDKNEFFFFLLEKNVKGAAITPLESLPRRDGKIIPDGQLAYIKLKSWFEGPIARKALAKHARSKIRTFKLHRNGNAGIYISTMVKLFGLLEESDEPLSDNAKIDALIDGIQDPRYYVLKKCVSSDLNIKYESVLAQFRSEEL